MSRDEGQRRRAYFVLFAIIVGALGFTCFVQPFLSALTFGDLQIRPQVLCFTKAEAALEILNDAKDPYFSKLQWLEIVAKTGQNFSTTSLDEARALTRKHYSNHVLEFSNGEKKAIARVVARICVAVSLDAPLLVRTSWKFLKVDVCVEGGLPHTRDAFIVLSERTLGRLFPEGAPCEQGDQEAMELFLHEQMHVLQRMKPGIFDGIYTKIWGFTKVTSIEGNAWLEERQLVNPDGTDVHWVVEIKNPAGVTRWLWPLLILRKPEESGIAPKLPRDFMEISLAIDKTTEGCFKVHVHDDEVPEFKDLYEDGDYLNRFKGQKNNLYHPHEAAASIFSNLLMTRNLAINSIPNGDHVETMKNYEGFEKLFDECMK